MWKRCHAHDPGTHARPEGTDGGGGGTLGRHDAHRLSEGSGAGPLPRFQKAMVEIHIATPRGSDNAKVWDTSNRAIQVILNNLKGIFFPDDDMEHMAFAVTGDWTEGIGCTTIRVSDFGAWRQIFHIPHGHLKSS